MEEEKEDGNGTVGNCRGGNVGPRRGENTDRD